MYFLITQQRHADVNANSRFRNLSVFPEVNCLTLVLLWRKVIVKVAFHTQGQSSSLRTEMVQGAPTRPCHVVGEPSTPSSPRRVQSLLSTRGHGPSHGTGGRHAPTCRHCPRAAVQDFTSGLNPALICPLVMFSLTLPLNNQFYPPKI